MLDKAGDMENDPNSNKNMMDPSSPDQSQNVDEDDTELELEEYADAFFEDGSFDESNPAFGTHEFSALNRQLDMLQSALDEIESRNAGIHKELLDILHSNREVRRTMQEENSEMCSSSSSTAIDDVPEEKGAAEQAKTKCSSSRGNKGQGAVASHLASVEGSDIGDEDNKSSESLVDGCTVMSDMNNIAALITAVTDDIDKL